jgi:hypothetical protein
MGGRMSSIIADITIKMLLFQKFIQKLTNHGRAWAMWWLSTYDGHRLGKSNAQT